jgi:tetratricopeptide (TPR) repeat protein
LSFYDGNLEQSESQLQEAIERYPRDADALALDLAMVQIFQGRASEAETTLRSTRDKLDFLEQKNLGESALAMLADDQQHAFCGEDYEKVLLRVMLALANLMHDGGDAEAYSLQINAKQQQLFELVRQNDAEIPDQAYRPLVIGPYLHGVLREATHGNYDDAVRAYTQVVSWNPQAAFARSDLERVQHGVHSQPGHGVLYLFALVGRGPYKAEAIEVPTSQALLIADRILSATGKHELPPTIAPLKIPVIQVPPVTVDQLEVTVPGVSGGRTETICDVAELAVQQNAARMPETMARAVVRRVVKKGAVYAAKDQLQSSSPWTDLALTAAGVAWEATESADTRCWGLLPRQIQVLRMELPAGRHSISVRPLLAERPRGNSQNLSVPIEDGRNSYVLVYFPDDKPIGQLLQHTP